MVSDVGRTGPRIAFVDILTACSFGRTPAIGNLSKKLGGTVTEIFNFAVMIVETVKISTFCEAAYEAFEKNALERPLRSIMSTWSAPRKSGR